MISQGEIVPGKYNNIIVKSSIYDDVESHKSKSDDLNLKDSMSTQLLNHRSEEFISQKTISDQMIYAKFREDYLRNEQADVPDDDYLRFTNKNIKPP